MPGVRGRSGGRNALTTQEHQQQGTFRADRHGDTPSPEPPVGVPTSPKELTGDAADEWGRMVHRLSASKTLSIVDDAVLYQYCQLFAETERIAITQLETAATIDIVEENLGHVKGPDLTAAIQEITKLRQLESRYTSQIQRGRGLLRTFLVEFGLTPAARSRVKVIGSEKSGTAKSPLAALQAQARALRAVN